MLVRVNGNSITFKSQAYGSQYYPIDSLFLDKDKVLENYPDLRDEKEWNKMAITRVKEIIFAQPSEEAKMQYLIKELQKAGLKPVAQQKNGWRKIKFIK